MALSKSEQKVFEELRKKKGVTVVGYGYKETNGRMTSEKAIVVGVKEKLPIESIDPKEIIPQSALGAPTDVQERGEIFALGVENKERQRPASPGCSIAHKDVTAGTFGALVKVSGVPFLLSNNHVLAAVNRGKKGDAILQPGPYDGGLIPNDVIATLERFIEIEFLSASNCPVTKAMAAIFNAVARIVDKHSRFETVRAITNLVDCALARPMHEIDVTNNIFGIGIPSGTAVPQVGVAVQKSGRTTGFTKGAITLVSAMANVNMGNNQIAVFQDQFEVEGTGEAFSAGGDSGSLVLNAQKQAVGLLFAGSDTKTYCNNIQNVIDKLGLDSF